MEILYFSLLCILLSKYCIFKILFLSVFSKKEGLKKANGENLKNSKNQKTLKNIKCSILTLFILHFLIPRKTF